MRRALLLILAAAACGRESPAAEAEIAPAPLASIALPADYVPGGVYGLDAETCRRHGGAETTDGSGIKVCALGEIYAVYVCEGGEIATLVERGPAQKILHLSSGLYGEVEPVITASGEKWGGEHRALWMKGDEALLESAEETRACMIAKR